MSAALWTSEEAAEALQTPPAPVSGVWKAMGLSIDSRTLHAGDIFLALRGPNHDGHRFISESLAKGAAAIIAEDVSEQNLKNIPPSRPVLQVADSYDALWALARYARKRSSAHSVAITGSVGKTGTVNALFHALGGDAAKIHAAHQSYNNQYGVPLTLARMPRATRAAIFEIGMNHSGEISPLAALVAPDLAIITAIAPAHLAFFQSLEEIAEAKAEIFDGLKKGGAAILNRDSRFFDFLRARALEKGAGRILSFGDHAKSDVRLLSWTPNKEGAAIEALLLGKKVRYRLPHLSRAHAQNSLAVLAALHLMGKKSSALQRLATMAPMAGRGRKYALRIKGKRITLIDESYSASPAAMQAALQSFALEEKAPQGRRVALLGDMKELGKDSKQFHQDLLPFLKEAHLERLFCCGEMMRHLYESAPASMRADYQDEAKSLLPALQDSLLDGDVLLVKGSHSMNLNRIVQALLQENGGAA